MLTLVTWPQAIFTRFLLCLPLHTTPDGSMVRNLLATQETKVPSLCRKDSLEKEMAAHSSILAWVIPWTEEPGGLQSMGLQESDTSQQQTAQKQPQGKFKSRSVVSDSLQPGGLYPTRLLLSMGSSRQEYWSALPFPSPGDLPDPGIEPGSPALEANLSPRSTIQHCIANLGDSKEEGMR